MRIYIAVMTIQSHAWLVRAGRILRDMGGNTLVCLELYSYTYDRRPAIRGSSHDPRAADAAAVKKRARTSGGRRGPS